MLSRIKNSAFFKHRALYANVKPLLSKKNRAIYNTANQRVVKCETSGFYFLNCETTLIIFINVKSKKHNKMLSVPGYWNMRSL
jgi:hypothetical protein